ncbi:hypothetical protein TthSNM11_13980 [Thermus thermophilus]|nr:hypothetical protein TthSNM11_13980 [Thermus thermophilus]
MRHALFFDAHLGHAGWERWWPALREAVEAERARGARIVWAGDTLDWVEDSRFRPPEGLLREGDIWIPGNHDPEAVPGLEVRHFLLLDGVFVAHGDQVDLQYAFALLEGRFGLRRSSALALYRGLIAAPDWAAQAARAWLFAFLHGGRPSTPARALLAVSLPLLLALFVEVPDLYPPVEELPQLPVFSRDPEIVLQKLLALEPQAREAHTLVIGHLHPVPHVDAQVGGQRLVIAPAWPTWPHAGYVVVEDGEVEVRRVSAD